MPAEKSNITVEDFFETNVANSDKEMLELGKVKDRIREKIAQIKEQMNEFRIKGYSVEVEKTDDWLEYAEIKLSEDKLLDKNLLIRLEKDANTLVDYFSKKLKEL